MKIKLVFLYRRRILRTFHIAVISKLFCMKGCMGGGGGRAPSPTQQGGVNSLCTAEGGGLVILRVELNLFHTRYQGLLDYVD